MALDKNKTRWHSQALIVKNGILKGEMGTKDILKLMKRFAHEQIRVALASRRHLEEIMSWDD